MKEEDTGWLGAFCMNELKKNVNKTLVGNLRECDHLEGLELDGWIVLKWISKEQDGVCELD